MGIPWLMVSSLRGVGGLGVLGLVGFSPVAEFSSPPKVDTFSFIVGTIIPKSVKCIHSATE